MEFQKQIRFELKINTLLNSVKQLILLTVLKFQRSLTIINQFVTTAFQGDEHPTI